MRRARHDVVEELIRRVVDCPTADEYSHYVALETSGISDAELTLLEEEQWDLLGPLEQMKHSMYWEAKTSVLRGLLGDVIAELRVEGSKL